MEILTKPRVYLVGRQVVDEHALDDFLLDTDVAGWSTDTVVPAEVLVEVAGRACYLSFKNPRPGGNAAYIGHLKEVQHGSVCEHAVWNFLITGISRACSHELVRHRVFSFSQLSQRYVDESVAEYVEPDVIASDPELHAIWREAVEQSHTAYVKLANAMLNKAGMTCPHCQDTRVNRVSGWCPGCETYTANRITTEERKAARQAARSVLPNATETKIFVTANARGLRNFLELRASRHAEPEIRKLANVMFDLLLKDSPNLFSDYSKVPLPDGTFELTTPHRKI